VSPLALDTVVLKSGSHDSPEAGMCAMEAVAWLAGEPHSDHPACACPVVSAAVRRLNDSITDDATRTELLRPLLPRLVGSRASREVMVRRGFVAADFAVRVFAPMALEARGKPYLAASLRGCAPIVDRDTLWAGRSAAANAANAAAAYAAKAANAAAAYAAKAANAANAAANAANAAAAAAYAAAYAAAAAAADAADAAEADDDRAEVYREAVRMIETMLDVRE
jgi:hypothetical protein